METETNGKLEPISTSTLVNKKDRKMKNIQFIYSKTAFLLGLVFITVSSCERPYSDEVEFATHSSTGEIFLDNFTGGLDYFPFGGSFEEAFSVDKDEAYKGEASMRFDIPSYGVGYGGATFPSTSPRNLTSYDALTFWAKASQGADINEIGFGTDGTGSKYQVTLSNLAITTQWTKYIIPIPDASKLFQEIGMFWYAEGAETADDEGGYTFWIDELKFEKLGTVAQPQPSILNGEDVVQQSFTGVEIQLTDLTQTFNLESGKNQSVTVAPSYFLFTSSDPTVLEVNEYGVVTVTGTGTATITAELAGVKALGSLTIESTGSFQSAPIPTADASNVISIFSDQYTNEPVDYYNGYWAPYQTTLGQDDVNLNGDAIIKYSELNFVGIEFTNPTIDISEMTHFHVDIQVQSDMASSDFLQVKLQDAGSDNAIGTSDDSDHALTYNNTTLVKGSWVSIDVPLSSFSGLTSRANLAQVVFVSDATITDILVDNIYFYKQ